MWAKQVLTIVVKIKEHSTERNSAVTEMMIIIKFNNTINLIKVD